MEYLGARKFHTWTCCTGGILSQYHAGIHWAEYFWHVCVFNTTVLLGQASVSPSGTALEELFGLWFPKNNAMTYPHMLDVTCGTFDRGKILLFLLFWAVIVKVILRPWFQESCETVININKNKCNGLQIHFVMYSLQFRTKTIWDTYRHVDNTWPHLFYSYK